jgi:ubiquinone/menaquinone biosynthesis C-methylase UbiE
MSLRTRLFAAIYDRQMTKTERDGLAALRRDLLVGVHGAVLEIGGGTGANLAIYGPGVDALTVTEPDPHMLRRLEAHAAERRPGTTVIGAPAEDLPFPDATFDVAISTLVLCGVPDQMAALAELRRVLKPGGELRFVEHVRADDDRLAHHQDRMDRVNHAVVGCHCNRATLAAIEASGFRVRDLSHAELAHAPKFVRPCIVGTATAPIGAVTDAEPRTASRSG